MAQTFLMPQLGSTMEEGTILKWHKQEGDSVKSGEILLEIETDKATMEVEAPTDGIVRKILMPADSLIPIRTPIAIIATADESIDHLLPNAGNPPALANGAGSPPSDAGTNSKHLTPNTQHPTPDTLFLSPRARRRAGEMGVAAASLAGLGTGPQGRVVERDIDAYLAKAAVQARTNVGQDAEFGSVKSSPRTTPLAARIADDLGVDINDLAAGLPGSRVRSSDVLRHHEYSRQNAGSSAKSTDQVDGITVIPFGGMRKRIADNVAKSAQTAPHVTLTLEVDMTECTEFRKKLIPEIEKLNGARVSFTDILVKAVARGLNDHPTLNATLAGNEIHRFASKNIGIAVALDEGLIVPVLKDADRKPLGSLSAELKQLVDRARTGKFTPDDLSGGTFSITNLGAFGIDVFDPIIVTGQAAILGVGRIADKAVVVNKEIVIRSMMNLCLSFDHRIVDGAPAARFLQRVKELLENPLLILI